MTPSEKDPYEQISLKNSHSIDVLLFLYEFKTFHEIENSGAPHPAAPGSNPGIPKKIFWE